MFSKANLTPEERAEMEAAYESACLDTFGDFTSTPTAGPLLQDEIDGAIQAHRQWARWLHDDIVEQGYKSAVRKWQNQQRTHKTIIDGKVMTKKDALRVRKAQEDGTVAVQTTIWPDATPDDLAQKIREANANIAAQRVTIRDAMRLIDLIEQTETRTAGDAVAAIGLTLDEFLTQDGQAA